MEINKLKIEFLAIFVVLPILLATPLWIYIKLVLVLLGLIYCIIISRNEGLFKKNKLLEIEFNFKPIAIRILVVLMLTTGLMLLIDPDNLFIVVRKSPLMWISISIFYSVFSVYPQEFLYRLFFFERYRTLFGSTLNLIIVNSLVFSLAHLLFWNGLVLVLTLVGGVLFAMTFHRTNSLMYTSIEHAIYGVWLFTLGMGEMLAFPMPK